MIIHETSVRVIETAGEPVQVHHHSTTRRTIHPRAHQETQSRTPRPERGKLYLTPCEREVLQLKATGKPTKAVAAELFISKRTVDFHLASIYKRFEVNSLLVACTMAAKAGLITMDCSPTTTEASA